LQLWHPRLPLLRSCKAQRQHWLRCVLNRCSVLLHHAHVRPHYPEEPA
jgi:hypothetical protein